MLRRTVTMGTPSDANKVAPRQSLQRGRQSLRIWKRIGLSLCLGVASLIHSNDNSVEAQQAKFALSDQQPKPVDTLVFCPRGLRQGLEPWLRFRTEQGHVIQVVEPAAVEHMRQLVRDYYEKQNKALQTVVMIGDVPNSADPPDQVRDYRCPTAYIDATINVHFGSEKQIATDNPIVDVDGDGSPDVATGRIPADSNNELQTIVSKILSYEREMSLGIWRRKINLVAGVGGFDPVSDAVIDMSARKFIMERIPLGYQTTMTYGSWRSPYCPCPEHFRDATLYRLNEGCLFWVYIGHGQRGFVAPIETPDGYFPSLRNQDAKFIASATGMPIAIFLACYTTAFDGDKDCLAEEMLRRPQGPVAVLGASRVSMPYAMAVMADELMVELFQNKQQTLGGLVKEAKRRSMNPASSDDELRSLVDQLAKVFSPTKNKLAEERAENVALFNLMGDPLLRLHHPQTLELKADAICSGEYCRVTGNSPVAGRMVVEVAVRRDRIQFPFKKREDFVRTEETAIEYNDAYFRSNDQSVCYKVIDVPAGPFEVDLYIPSKANGVCCLRGYVAGRGESAIGGEEVRISRPKATPSTIEQRQAQEPAQSEKR